MDKKAETLFSDTSNPISDIKADFSNLIRKYGELDHEMNEFKSKAESDIKKILLDIIEGVDAFENVFKNVNMRENTLDQQTRILIGNFRTVYRLLLRSLKTVGVVPIEVIVGEKADPHWHTVAEVSEDFKRDNETIIEEIKKGYVWNGKILRTAEVKAIRNKIKPNA